MVRQTIVLGSFRRHESVLQRGPRGTLRQVTDGMTPVGRNSSFRLSFMQPAKGSFDKRGEEVAESDVARKKTEKSGERPVSLKILADYLGLCPATVSVVLNNVPGRSIPPETRERVRAAARKFNYQPSLLARSLRKQRTFTVGVLVPELSDGYHTMVMSGIGDHLMREGYFYFSAHHR